MSNNPIHILLVEDEAAHAELISRSFAKQNGKFKIHVANTIAEASGYLKESKPSLIITDWRLPDGEGTSLIEMEDEYPTIPVVVMTSHGNERVAVDAIKNGALDYVVKSDNALVEMHHTAERALREWNHLVHRRQAENELRQRVLELESVNRISTAMRAAETLDEMIPRLLDEILAVLNLDTGIIWLYDPNMGCLNQIFSRSSFPLAEITQVPPDNGIVGTTFSNGETYYSREIVSDPLSITEQCCQFPPGWCGVFVPIHTTTEVVGIILIAARSPREIRKEEQHLLSTLADIAGNAIHRTRLYEQTQRNLERLASLRAIDQAITSNNELDLTLNILLGYAKNQLDADAVGILRLDPVTNTLNYTNGQGFGSMFRPPSPIRVGEGYAGIAVLERRPIFTSDLDQSGTAFVTGRVELATYEMFQSYHVIPLFTKGSVRGVLETFHRNRFDPDEEWKDYFESLASQAAIAIDNAELFNSLQKSNLDLIIAYDATIEGWSRALDLRDRETEGHTQRVASMALQLAKVIGIKENKLLHMRRGALLHDIGKMGIPDKILFKEGPLDKYEWEIMRKHPVFAYEMLSPIKYLAPALDIPYCHHEKWDGTGYPRGLSGEQIPQAARIFAVADVWDALTSKRPYRDAWSKEKTYEHILKNSGSHFDPAIVEAFSTLSLQ